MKKRNEDLMKNKSIYGVGLFSIIIFSIVLFSLHTVPKIFTESRKNFYTNLSTLNNKNFDKIFSKEKNNILNLYKEKDINKNAFKNIDKDILAKSYVVYDVKNDKIIASRNENEILPLASLTKVVTAITAINLQNKNSIITIDSSKMRQDESLDIGMKEGQKWRLSDLLRYGLVISSNSSMDIIASSVSSTNADFVAKMNDYVKSFGFKDFYFNSASGLDYGEVIGGKGTALEYAKLFAKSYKLIPDIMSYTTNSKVNIKSDINSVFHIPNTNKEASRKTDLLASKTGFTDAAGGNLAVMFDFGLNRPIVIVVLGSTLDGRFSDVDTLYKTLYVK